ncbi:hypothetical protein J2S70_000615 [Trueperella bonasi]|uniref:Uncharacterized protein n=1 Tax=Trueperella bonasi TaxID=312286 RepID=A0ABT9NF61_9ACTO|nr:hypothetical protein [Trueperella bonasi]MDP9806033.1 hypothetical protein [Trueperella bonasi]
MAEAADGAVAAGDVAGAAALVPVCVQFDHRPAAARGELDSSVGRPAVAQPVQVIAVPKSHFRSDQETRIDEPERKGAEATACQTSAFRASARQMAENLLREHLPPSAVVRAGEVRTRVAAS